MTATDSLPPKPAAETSDSEGVSCAASAGYPSFAARHRKGQETVELRVPTGDDACPHCWHGLDFATAKRLRYEICEAVEKLESLMDCRKWGSEKTKLWRRKGRQKAPTKQINPQARNSMDNPEQPPSVATSAVVRLVASLAGEYCKFESGELVKVRPGTRAGTLTVERATWRNSLTISNVLAYVPSHLVCTEPNDERSNREL